MTWKPIETAPKDRSSILLASDLGHVALGSWFPPGKAWLTNIGTFHDGTRAGGKPCRITHWMPLPPPPEA